MTIFTTSYKRSPRSLVAIRRIRSPSDINSTDIVVAKTSPAECNSMGVFIEFSFCVLGRAKCIRRIRGVTTSKTQTWATCGQEYLAITIRRLVLHSSRRFVSAPSLGLAAMGHSLENKHANRYVSSEIRHADCGAYNRRAVAREQRGRYRACIGAAAGREPQSRGCRSEYTGGLRRIRQSVSRRITSCPCSERTQRGALTAYSRWMSSTTSCIFSWMVRSPFAARASAIPFNSLTKASTSKELVLPRHRVKDAKATVRASTRARIARAPETSSGVCSSMSVLLRLILAIVGGALHGIPHNPIGPGALSLNGKLLAGTDGVSP